MSLWFIINIIISALWYSRNKTLETKSYYLSKLISNTEGQEKMDAETQWTVYVKDNSTNRNLGWACIISWFLCVTIYGILNP